LIEALRFADKPGRLRRQRRAIGEGIVRRFVKEGAKLVFTSLLTAKANALKEELGKSAVFYRANSANPSENRGAHEIRRRPACRCAVFIFTRSIP
jgi:hypothetical protein